MARKSLPRRRRTFASWQPLEVAVGPEAHRGRYRVEGDHVVLECREGRFSEFCGHMRPDAVATWRLRQILSERASPST